MKAEGAAALALALDGCEIAELDSADRRPACTVVTEGGKFLKLAGLAAQLTLAVRAGRSLDELGEVDRACGDLAARLVAARAAPPSKPRTFLVHREWLGAATVNAWARRLAPACGPRWMVGAGASAVAIVIAMLHTATPPAFTVGMFWLAYFATLPILLVHELGHAAACAHHGARVGPIGAAIYIIYPALYCDVTDTWRLRRWQRVAVDLGGIYFQLVITAVLAVLWRLTGVTVLYATTMASVAIMMTNLIPFFSLDGYWCLSDALGVVNLGAQRRVVFAGVWARIVRRPAPPFPWPPVVAAAVMAYSVVALGFGIYIAVRLIPHAVAQLGALPGYAGDLAGAIGNADALAGVSALGRLATAGVVAVFTFVMVRRLVRAATRSLAAALRRRVRY